MKKKRQIKEDDAIDEGVDIPQRLHPLTEEECVTEHQLVLVLKKKLADQASAFGKERLEYLSRIASYEQDGEYALFFSMNRKANETARSLNGFELSLTSESKSFERYMMLIKLLPDQTATLDKLRQDYLKIDKTEVNEIEKKGVPLIEQQRGAVTIRQTKKQK